MFQKLSEEYKVGTDQIVELWRELYASDLEDFFLAFDLRDQESITRFILDSFLEKQDGLATIPSVEKILNSGRGVLESELRKYYSEETFNNFYRNNKKD